MNLRHKLIAGAAGLLAVGGIGAGVAAAQTSPNPSSTTLASAEPADPDTDHVQQGDQHSPDTKAAAAVDREAASAGDTDGNHEDRDGANVDFTPAGERPEASDRAD